ncbi:MAG: aerotolerance regulator BatA [Chlamydiae bacterium]|nr:MAG: aerotolerance regulator BatA [Chlamydiota bacterium]
MLRFHDPLWFFLLLLIPVIIWYYFRANSGGTIKYSSISTLKKIHPSASLYYRHVVLILRCGAIILLAIALARPQKGKEDTKVTTEGIDIILAVDTSGSMVAGDLTKNPDVSRLDVAKQVVEEFIKKRKNDKIGLVVYGEDAYTQCPLTLDYGVLLKFLDKCKIGIAGQNSTSIGDAIATSVLRMEKSKAKSKIIILLTDGRNNSGLISPETAAEMARELGVKIYTVGVGTKALYAPVPAIDMFGGKTYQRMPVDIDERLLNEIANVSSGKYFRATNKNSLKKIYEDINKMEKTKTEVFHYMEYKEQFTDFAIAGAILLILEILLKNTIFRRLP